MPLGNLQAFIQRKFCLSPIPKSSLCAEEEIAVVPSRLALQNRKRLTAKRKLMLALVFGPSWRKHNHLARKVYLAPLQSADLLPALPGQQKQSHDIAVSRLPKSSPKLPQLAAGQYSLPRSTFIGLGGALDRVGVEQAFGDGPSEERAQG